MGEAWWKARAVYKGNGVFDIVHDRQKWGGDEETIKELCHWVLNTAFGYVREGMRRQCTGVDNDGIFEVEEGNKFFWCSPKSSYGYLFMKAWTEGAERDMESSKGYF